jgi:hypothetical protein
MNRRRDMCWEARNARRDRRDMAGGAGFGGNGRRFFTEPLTSRARVGSPRFSLCPASPERPLWDGDGLGAPDTVSGRAGQKWAWGTRLERIFCPARPKSLWGTLWGTRLEMLLEYYIEAIYPMEILYKSCRI